MFSQLFISGYYLLFVWTESTGVRTDVSRVAGKTKWRLTTSFFFSMALTGDITGENFHLLITIIKNKVKRISKQFIKTPLIRLRTAVHSTDSHTETLPFIHFCCSVKKQ